MEEFKELHQSITDNANAIYRKANIVTLTVSEGHVTIM